MKSLKDRMKQIYESYPIIQERTQEQERELETLDAAFIEFRKLIEQIQELDLVLACDEIERMGFEWYNQAIEDIKNQLLGTEDG